MKFASPNSSPQFGGLSGESQGTMGVDWRSLPVCLINDWLYLVNDVNCICGGNVGTSGKVCGKHIDDCGTMSHLRSKQALVPGFYVRASQGDMCFLAQPHAPISGMDEETLDKSLRLNFETTKKAISYIQQLGDMISVASSPVTFKEVEQVMDDFYEAVKSKTPAKRRKVDFREVMDVFQDELFEESKDVKKPAGSPSSSDPNMEYTELEIAALKEKLRSVTSVLGNSIAEDREEMKILGDKISHINNEIGSVPPKNTLPSTLWLAVDHLNEEVDKLIAARTENVNTDSLASKTELDEAERRIDSELTQLNNELVDKAADLTSQLRALKGAADLSGTSYSSVVLLNMAIDTVNSRLESMDNRLDSVAEETRRLGTRSSKSNSFITVGKHLFHSIPELMTWVDKNLPEDIPFGAFVDPYSLLERISSCKDAALTSELKNMELRKKLNLKPDEAISLNGFNHSLPKYFYGNHGDKWLSGIPTASKLLSEDHLTGVKVTINEGMESTRERIEVNATIRLSQGKGATAEAKAIARATCSDSCEFVNEILTFAVDTNNQLVSSGFAKDEAWNLVSKLIHRIFAVDCNSRRAIAKENINGSNAKELAGGVLWATFATHDVMREYRKYGIKNHPSIASEYVRFLVAHSGLRRLAKLETQVASFDERIKTLTAELQKVAKSATTAANKADQAMALAKKEKKG